MPTGGIIIFIFTILSITLPLIFIKKLRIVLNKYYMIITILSIFCLLYFLIGRYFLDINELVQKDYGKNEIRHQQLISKALLLDMCPLMALLLPIFSMFKKTRKIALILCPITIIGSSITIFGQIIWEDNYSMNQFFKYFFVGIWPNRLYFMMHFLTLFLAVIILISNYHYSLKDMIYTILFYFLWFFYVNIIVVSLNIQWNASGLVQNDWINPNGQYHTMYRIWPLPFPEICIFWYFIILIVNALIILLKNICTKKLDNKTIKSIYMQPNLNYYLIIKNKINSIKHKKIN